MRFRCQMDNQNLGGGNDQGHLQRQRWIDTEDQSSAAPPDRGHGKTCRVTGGSETRLLPHDRRPSISNTRSRLAVCRSCCAWWPTSSTASCGTSERFTMAWRVRLRRRLSISDPTPSFAGYSVWAEMTCFLVLGWNFPVHLLDQHTAYLAASNILLPYNPDEVRNRQRKRLSDACRAYGIEAGKTSTRKRSPGPSVKGDGAITVSRVFDYCEEDVRNSVVLLRAIRGHGAHHRSTPLASCTGPTTVPKPWHRSRPAACRSTCRCGTRCRRTRPR